MSETRIRRGGTGRLSTTRVSSGRSKTMARPRAGGAKKKTGLGRLLAMVPISPATQHRLATGAIVLAVVGIGWGVASFFGLPGMARMEIAEMASRAGFQVEKVEVRGVERMDELPVYNIALGQVDRSMLNLDLSNLRSEMLKLAWVKDARISRRLPDTLVVDIVERQPVAVWQHDGRLALIDVTGQPLEGIRPSELPDLPLVVGPRANLQTGQLTKLMDAAPSLKPVLAGATWVGNRRWDLRFQSGETLSLPEGQEQAAAALVEFTRLDGINRLLGRGIVRFDMRDPDKFVLRLPKDAGAKTNAAKSDAQDGDKPAPAAIVSGEDT
ncbi:cell division protein FtsQ/DivIB [Sphingobium subterraneum]|uniref:Cell division protein FtsQ n=1 Tax=Sphingobium subterraneum TaxID=627688 RepID=A0A841IY89_9SPHN|nr:cell division protein FtsQ/DivIB [Sphingobium subterraneum]MBB6123577.1 cell division protein FtsQ [Sphingobium subterraneum]